MDQLVQCPVCTLFLHNGMSLESHLDTHPKDQVIKALCSIANKNSSCMSSRTSTPANSERSYRSRSRTPAADDSGRWSSSHRNQEHERYWARTPSGGSSRAPSRTPSRNQSRTPRSSSSATVSRNCTPDIRMVDNLTYDTPTVRQSPQPSNHSNLNFTNPPLALKADKMQQTYPPPLAEYEPKYSVFPEQQEEREVKYSRSADYTPLDMNNVFSYNVPTMAATVKLQPTVIPGGSRKRHEPVKIVPKSSNLLNLVKSNIGSVQYIAPGKPMHVVVGSSAPTFVQKNVQNSMIMAGALPCSQVRDSKAAPPLVQNHFNQLSSSTFTPGTTVVTQNSQYFYQEMVQNIDPKGFIPSIPTVFAGQENVTNVAQSSSIYQNVMLVDQYGNTSCMYTAPQQVIPKQCPSQMYPETSAIVTNPQKQVATSTEHNKTLVIEVTPIMPPTPITSCSSSGSKVVTRPPRQVSAIVSNFTLPKTEAPNVTITEKVEAPCEASGSTKGLKILSNIKVEVPVQHSKSMINTVMDLTGCGEREYSRPASPDNFAAATSAARDSAIAFAELKRSASPASKPVDDKMDMEFSDSCPVPDLICNEKPSISPISELSESGDGCPERAPSPKTEPVAGPSDAVLHAKDDALHVPLKHFKSNPLRLNNIFVKKCKKVIQIKNLKPIAESSGPVASTSSALSFAEQLHKEGVPSTLKTISIEEIKGQQLAGFERAPSPPSGPPSPPSCPPSPPSCPPSPPPDVLVKEELSSSNEPGEARASPAPEGRTLLQLEAASKSKQLASMMSDNYFGDNMYEHYFAAEREEAFDDKGGACALWGEPSREPDFVLPTFIHESYKIADSGAEYEAEREHDSKLELLAAAPERAPWPAPYAPPAQPYDLLARETWLSDGSDLDVTEKQDNLDEMAVLCATRVYTCGACGAQLGSLKELRAHAARLHPPPAPLAPHAPLHIKKEEKEDACAGAGGGAAGEPKQALGASILRAYELAPELALRSLLAGKRRRRDTVCPTCKVDQGSEAAFAAHLRVHPLECLKCGKCFTRRANLTLHLKTHAGIKNYKCEVCEKRFLTRQKLSEHHNTHTGRAPVKCTLCDETFRRYSNMVQHRNRHHLKKRAAVRDFVCPCGLVVHSRAKLAWHQETHDPKPKACPHCPDRFVHAASLTRHVRRKHDAGYGAAPGGDVPCPVCRRPYLRANLRAHLATHSGARPFACVVCNKAFSTKWNLKLHRWTHAARSAKPHRCALCPAAFVRRAELAAHVNAHRAVRPYTCNYCGCQFIRKYNCQRHVREHEQAKRFVCDVPDCGKAFHRSYYLAEHRKVHSGARPFACAVCGKTSSNKSNHNKHLKIHHARDALATET